jgi:hypothetical protein
MIKAKKASTVDGRYQMMMEYLSHPAPDKKTGCCVCGEIWYMGERNRRYCEGHWARREGYACMEAMESAEYSADGCADT